MTRWEWLVYCLVQTIIIVGLLAVAASLGFSIWALLALLAALFFAWRCFNHPDFWLRRLSLFFASLGGTYLFVGGIIYVPDQGVWDWVKTGISIINMLSQEYRVGGIICLALSVIFAVLELIRIWLSDRNGGSADRLNLQIDDVREVKKENDKSVRLTFSIVVLNPTDNLRVVTGTHLTRLTLWPRTTKANVYEKLGATKVRRSGPVEIPTRSTVHLIFEASFTLSRWLPMKIYAHKIYRILFGLRRVSIPIKLQDNSSYRLIETGRLQA